MTDTRTNKPANSATDVSGRRITVGCYVSAVDEHGTSIGPPVRVTKIHRQGYDGTILTTDMAPETDYPHHFSRASRRCMVVWPVGTVENELETLRQRVRMLEVCAQPFIEFIDKYDRKPLGGIADDFYSIHAGEHGASLRLSDLRRLRAAVKS